MGKGITMNEVIDRVPGSPGRVMITPEDGSVPYYATVTSADNPIEEGTPINKELFDSIAAEATDGTLFIPETAGTNTYTAALEGFAEYKSGKVFIVKFTNANTGASTFNLNGLGAKPIVRGAGQALIASEIQANSMHILTDGGTYFHLTSVGTLVPNANYATSAGTASTAGTASSANYAASAGSATAATYAGYWTNPINLSLTGAVTGTASIRGNTAVSLYTTLAGGGATGGLKSIQRISGMYNAGGFYTIRIPITRLTNINRAIAIIYIDASIPNPVGGITATYLHPQYVSINATELSVNIGAGIYTYSSPSGVSANGWVLEFN